MIVGLTWQPVFHVWLGPFPVNVHSLGIAVGYGLGYLLLHARARERGSWHPAIGEASVAAIPGVLLGSRFFWALPLVLSGPIQLGDPRIWTLEFTNISFLGGLAGGLASGLVWLRWRGVHPSRITGLLADSVLLGLICARIGDVLVGDHLGERTLSALAFTLPSGGLPNGACVQAGDTCHQTALYELLFVAPLFLGAWLLRRRKISDRWVAAYVAGGYGLLRFFLVEPFRVTPRVWGLTGSQWACLALVAGAVIMLRNARAARTVRRAGVSHALGAAGTTLSGVKDRSREGLASGGPSFGQHSTEACDAQGELMPHLSNDWSR